MKLPVVFHQGEDNYIVAECPVLPGCISQGKIKEQAIENIREAIEGCIEVRREMGWSDVEEMIYVEVSCNRYNNKRDSRKIDHLRLIYSSKYPTYRFRGILTISNLTFPLLNLITVKGGFRLYSTPHPFVLEFNWYENPYYSRHFCSMINRYKIIFSMPF